MFTEPELNELELIATETEEWARTMGKWPRELLKRMVAQLRRIQASGCVPAEDEPSFTILARDQFAQAVVAFWISRAEAAGSPEAKIDRARQRYQEIIEFQSDHPERVKVPD